TVPNAGVPCTTVVGFRAADTRFGPPVATSLNATIPKRKPTEQRAMPSRTRGLKNPARGVGFAFIKALSFALSASDFRPGVQSYFLPRNDQEKRRAKQVRHHDNVDLGF